MNNTLYLPVPPEDGFDMDCIYCHRKDMWLKPLSLEEVRDYLAGVQGNDLASVASHACADGDSIEQPIAILKEEWIKEFDERNWENLLTLMPTATAIIVKAMERYVKQNKKIQFI